MEKRCSAKNFVSFCYNQAVKIIVFLGDNIFLSCINFPFFKVLNLFSFRGFPLQQVTGDDALLFQLVFSQFIFISFPLCEVLKILIHLVSLISPGTKNISCLDNIKSSEDPIIGTK